MYLIAGLGNPGQKYKFTRHNIGFRVIDSLVEFFNSCSYRNFVNYAVCITEYNGKTIVLMKPHTYMNHSGVAIKEFTAHNKLETFNRLIIFDDVYLDFGTIRIRAYGSDGGHNGMNSVIKETGTEEIPRLRIGIKPEGIKTEGSNLADFVLTVLDDEEEKALPEIIMNARDAVLTYIDKGINPAMNKYNKNFYKPNKTDITT